MIEFKEILLEVLKVYGITGLIVVSSLCFTGWMAMKILNHFTATIDKTLHDITDAILELKTPVSQTLLAIMEAKAAIERASNECQRDHLEIEAIIRSIDQKAKNHFTKSKAGLSPHR
jgi:hypothetical protein